MTRWLWGFLATRAATGWAIAAGIAVAGSLALYVQQLRVNAAYCKGQQVTSASVERLTNQYTETIEGLAKDDIDTIRQEGGCALEPAPPAVIDSLRD